jgi:hypothetical protein
MNNPSFYSKWAWLALLNFTVLAAVGMLLRYKILFPLPLIEQNHLLHGHSHFAFAGWVGLALYICIAYLLRPDMKLQKKFERLLIAQQISSYGMLFIFPFTGYAALSIAFSSSSIFISWVFAWLVIKELLHRKQYSIEKKWIITGLLCNVVSSAGTFALAYLMVTKNLRQDWYFGSVYFFLHFQYNGWFLFTIGAIFLHQLSKWMPVADTSANHIFNLLLIALVPAWFLSLMWMRIPLWMYYCAVAGAIVQLAALWFFVKLIAAQRKNLANSLHPLARWFWIIAGSAFALKLMLQGFSAIPQLNTYAFGIRAIVIGFLHLVLLAFVSVFIAGYFIQQQFIAIQNTVICKAAWLFITGVLANEFVLMLQGFAAIKYDTVPYANYLLLATALIIFISLVLLLSSGLTNKRKQV